MVEKKRIMNHNVFISLVINIVFLVLHSTFGRIFYVTNDDRFFADILSGAYGSKFQAFTYFSNVLYCFLITTFYELFPMFSWYAVINVIFCLVAFSLLTYIILDHFGIVKGVLFTLVLLWPFTYFHYIAFQWTHNAYLYSAIGTALMLYGCIMDKRKLLFCGFMFSLLGFMVRTDCFIAIFSVIAFSVIMRYAVIYLNKQVMSKKESIRVKTILINLIKSICLVLISVMLLEVIQKVIYYSDLSWRDYCKYNVLRAKIQDYGGIDYDNYEEELLEIQIDRQDAELFNEWVLADNEKFTTQKLSEIYSIKRQGNVKKWINNVSDNFILIRNLFEGELILLFVPIVLCIFISLRNIKNRGYMAFTITLIIGILIETGYLCISGRIVARVIYGMVLLYIVGTVFGACLEEKEIDRCYGTLWHRFGKTICMTCVSMLLIFSSIYQDVFNSTQQFANTKWRQATEYINQNKGYIFMIDIMNYSNLYCESYSVMEPLSADYCDNVYFMGGWYINSPATDEILKKYNIGNPMKEMDNKNVLVLDCNEGINRKVKYLENEYHSVYTITKVKDVDGKAGFYKIEKKYNKNS